MIGKEVLNYVIISQLGKGGMGSVYLAENKYITQQKVAIKMINADMVNDFTRRMLREEAEKLASLNHPNIVHFLNYHIDEKGNIYLIMEYADGVSLDNYIETISGLIVETKVCPLFEPILDAVEYAHNHEILHRDIKPNNLVITKDGIPMILDFGIAKIMNQNDDEKENLVMGTPSYMSPEQVRGEKLDARSDIYSLGVVLHQMLTGNAPYDTTTMTVHDINRKVVEEQLPRMKSYYKYVSDKVQKVVDKATAKNPKDRYQTCIDFKKALHAAIYPPKVPKWAVSSAAAILLLALGFSFYWWDYTRTKVYYFKDYTEQWGVPVGIGELSISEKSRMHRMYRLEYTRNKLVRLSHVNSIDVLIPDSESERYDRPNDAYYYYTNDDKVSRVKVLDNNGKVLYIKSYNENLTTAIFQYDDINNTEKTLGAHTIGYSHSLTDVDSNRSKISRWLLEYDENGYVKQLNYAGFQNVKVSDADNIYGRAFLRDSKGRIIQELYLGLDGMPTSAKWGLGIKRFTYDEDNNWIKSEYLTMEGNPSLDATDGVCVYELIYDSNNNLSYAYHKDSEGNLMLPKMHGVAGVHYYYDDHGYIQKMDLLGIDGETSYGSNGFAYQEMKCDEHGFLKEVKFFDVEGNLATTTNGLSIQRSIHDDHGNELEAWYYNSNDELVISDGGNAGRINKYDLLGNCIQSISYGTNRCPILNNNGEAGYLLEYDVFGRIVKYTTLGVDSLPSFDNNNIQCLKFEYDASGHEIKRYFCLLDGSLALSTDNIAGWSSSYDDFGNLLNRVYFDEDENPCNLANGYAKIVKTYDKNGYIATERYYDKNDQLVIDASDNCAGYNYKYDERGNLLEYYPVNTQQELRQRNLVAKYKYDKYNNQIEFAVFDKDKPSLNSNNYHRCTYLYNDRNQVIETRYYDTNGKLINYGSDTYAIEKSEYDLKGNRTKLQYFDISENPVVSNEGWASSLYEYDAFGNITRQLFFGIDGKPTKPEIMVPEGVCRYDQQGNMIYIAAMDGHGNLIRNPNTGWSIARYEYDSKKNRISCSYYAEDDKPIISKNDHFHKIFFAYNLQNKVVLEAYYNIDGKPMLVNGYHKEVTSYDDQGRTTNIEIFDTEDKPINGANNYQKLVFYYEGDSQTSIKCCVYSASGKLIKTMINNNGEWVQKQSSTAWQESIREIQNELPLDLGDDLKNLLVQSCVIIGANSCKIAFKTPISKYEMADTDLDFYKTCVNYFLQQLSTDKECANVHFTGVLQDSKGRELYKSTN